VLVQHTFFQNLKKFSIVCGAVWCGAEKRECEYMKEGECRLVVVIVVVVGSEFGFGFGG